MDLLVMGDKTKRKFKGDEEEEINIDNGGGDIWLVVCRF